MKTPQLTEEVFQRPHSILWSHLETASFSGAWPPFPQLGTLDCSDDQVVNLGLLDPVVPTADTLKAGGGAILKTSPVSSGTSVPNT